MSIKKIKSVEFNVLLMDERTAGISREGCTEIIDRKKIKKGITIALKNVTIEIEEINDQRRKIYLGI